MRKDIARLTMVNAQLVKSLQRYIFIVALITTSILFAGQLFNLDSYKYYSKSNDRVMTSEADYIDINEYEVANNILSSSVDSLSSMGVDIDSYEVIMQTSITFTDTPTQLQRNAIFATDDAYLSSISDNIVWLFKNELSSNGIYISKNDYNNLNSNTSLRLTIYGSTDVLDVMIDGVYESKVSKYVFYSNYDSVTDHVILSKSILEVTSPRGSFSATNILLTKNPITNEDLKYFDLFFDNPITGLKNYNESLFIIQELLTSIDKLLWVISITLIVLSVIMLYRYFIEVRSIIRIYYLFYASIKRSLFMQIFSGIYVISKPFILPILLFTLPAIYVNFQYNYFLSDILINSYIYLIFVLFIIVISINNTILITKRLT